MRNYIVIVLDDDGRYVQAAIKRFTMEGAKKYATGVAPGRLPAVVVAPRLVLDERDYPVKDVEGKVIPDTSWDQKPKLSDNARATIKAMVQEWDRLPLSMLPEGRFDFAMSCVKWEIAEIAKREEDNETIFKVKA